MHNGEEIAKFLPKSTDVLLELIHEFKIYDLDGVTALLKPVSHENVVSYPCMQDQITHLFEYSDNHSSDFGGSIPSIKITQQATTQIKDEVKFMHKHMRDYLLKA